MINLEITPSALTHLYKQSQGLYPIIVDIKPIGCSGWTYNIFAADSLSNLDEKDLCGDYVVNLENLENKVMQVYVLRRAAAIMDGATIDYVKDGLQKKLHVTNPNVKAHCGCGSSFSISK
jgi:iron-sulfur cluster assembly accessory protein